MKPTKKNESDTTEFECSEELKAKKLVIETR